jgi:hypothetical protein
MLRVDIALMRGSFAADLIDLQLGEVMSRDIVHGNDQVLDATQGMIDKSRYGVRCMYMRNIVNLGIKFS